MSANRSTGADRVGADIDRDEARARTAGAKRRRVLVTGVAGYIGSHTALALDRAGYEVIGWDNFSNSSPRTLSRLRDDLGCSLQFRELDVLDESAVRSELSQLRPDAVIHFAGLKSVEDSCARPEAYYRTNVGGTLTLLEAMRGAGVQHLVFSSSATVYDASQSSPLAETASLACVNPYGWSKLFAEQLIADFAHAAGGMTFLNLRYFNPVGADPSGVIGESPVGPPANLMPALCEAASRRAAFLSVFGNDYPTRDGTGVRDYIHIADLAQAHVLALAHLLKGGPSATVNLGSGSGYSVLELVRAFERASGVRVPLKVCGRRPGDAAEVYADPTLAERLLGWRSTSGLDQMCADAWHWHQSSMGHHDAD